MVQTQELKTLDDVRGLLTANQGVEIQMQNREAACAFIAQNLGRLRYRRLGEADKGLVRAYLAKATGLVAEPWPVPLRGATSRRSAGPAGLVRARPPRPTAR
jgi:hypothetical protein